MSLEEAQVYPRVQQIFAQVFEQPDIEVKPEMDASWVDTWDSLSHMKMISAIEKEFGVKFKLKEVTKMKNVGDMVAILQERGS